MKQSTFNKLLFGADPSLRAYALNLTRDQEAANDLYQETALKAFKYRDKFRADSNFNAWAITLMKNTFINDYRRRKRRNTVFDFTPDQYLLNSSEQVVRNEGESIMTMEELQTFIDTLPDKLRIPFLMQYQGYRYDEISSYLDVPEGTIKSRIHFARKRLKHRIAKEYSQHSISELVA